MLSLIDDFHPRHDECVDERACYERYERCCCYAWCKPEDGMESLVSSPVFSSRKPVAQCASRYKKEIQEKALPDKKLRLAVSPYLTDTVVYDVADREDNKSASLAVIEE